MKDRRLADYAMVFELLSTLPELTTEDKVIERILELFSMLFAPEHLVYISLVDGKMSKVFPTSTPFHEVEVIKSTMTNCEEEYLWTDSNHGFILRICLHDRTLGVIKVEGMSFPQYKEHYLNLALTIIRVCALAISNARTYEKIKVSEESLKHAYDALKRSQAQLIQAEKMSALGTMVAGIAHELNNPLMVILNYIQYCLRKTSDDDKRFSVLHDTEKQTKRCIDVVNSLLAFSHMDEELDGGFQKTRCSTVLKQVLRLLSYRIAKEEVKITTSCDGDMPEVSIKMNSIQQVFINIILNSLDALKDCDKKEIHIAMGVTDKFVHIKITDSGPGIAQENLEKIFDPFFTTKPTGQGTGLGLSICRSIIDMHGGKITCHSKPGQGTEFTILLPLEIKMR
jgi:signal transduction histidine kinase